MKVVSTIDEVRQARAGVGELGLVPTMGFLHDGHIALVSQAKAECGTVAASIFVNPTQFGPGEDFAAYPRDLQRDLARLAEVGTDLVFVPTVDTMYPPGFATSIDVGPVAQPLEGAARPGHFAGVATVVCKLLNIVQPTRAYFGQKDAQQVAVIQAMARDLAMPSAIVVVPTLREPDGLAMSSRNIYLGPAERQAATVLHRALSAARERWLAGERDAEALRATMRAVLADEPLAQAEYVSAADPLTLRELAAVGAAGVLLSMAVRVGRARLIDNMRLGPA